VIGLFRSALRALQGRVERKVCPRLIGLGGVSKLCSREGE
jgi:hypothetical protein